MNPPEQKEPEEEPSMNSLYQVEVLLEQGETFVCDRTYFHDNKFCINRQTLKYNLDSIKRITKLRDENKKIEKRIKQQLTHLDKEREEFIKEKREQEEHYKDCHRKLDMRTNAIENAVRDCSEDKMVSLNIGGQVFVTLKSTISNISPFFANLFSDAWRDTGLKTIRDSAGNIFIDRSPCYFPYLLDWSRNGRDPQELRSILQLICEDTINMRTFMKTMEYYGIDHEFCHIDSDLNIGNRIDIYWRGDKRTYKGTITRLCFDDDDNDKDLFAIIKYDDGQIWKYKVKWLDKTNGPYKCQILSDYSHTRIKSSQSKWWHYGEDKGGKKLAEKYVIHHCNPTPTTGDANQTEDDDDSDGDLQY